MDLIGKDSSQRGTKSINQKPKLNWWERASTILIVLGLLLSLLWGGLIVAALAWFVRFLLG